MATVCRSILICCILGMTSQPFRIAGGDQSQLVNPGFEDGLQGWRQTTYGASPVVVADPETVHSGRASLRISSESPSDTALSQDIVLPSGRFYRLTGWVKTKAVNPMGSPVFGTIQVQGKGGQPILASGDNHAGETDWTRITAFFRAPADGITHIALFFVGFGKGTGTVWFDDIRIETVDLTRGRVVITDEPLCPGRISPFQYGQFIEYLCDLVPSMWAEKLYDGSFEGLTPYTMAFNRETDFKEKPWHPVGGTRGVRFTRDRENQVSGSQCGRIEVAAGSARNGGIAQDRIFVEKGGACTFSCWLRASTSDQRIIVRITAGGRNLAHSMFSPTLQWGKFRAKLIPSERNTNATISIEVAHPGTVWIDNASFIPDNSIGGWRRDVVEAVRALKPGIIRFGGSALDDPNLGSFEWKDTIGDPDHRKPFRAWGGLQPVGPGLEEIVRFCKLVGAEPLICVRIRGEQPEDAAEQVEYFNGSTQTRMGALRARNGHREPYRIKFWQIGNEQSGREYESRLRAFGRAIKGVDPSIKVLSSYPTPGVLDSANDVIDYVCPHHYACTDIPAARADFDRIRKMIADHSAGSRIKIGVTEWNTTAGDWGPGRAGLWNMANALACARYHNLLHRECDLVEIANRSNLSNSFCSGILQTNNHTLYLTPTYHAQQLYSTLAGTRPLRIQSDVPADIGLDLSATLSEDGKSLTIFAVNDGPEPIERTIGFSRFVNKPPSAEEWVLSDSGSPASSTATNTFENPNRVATRYSRLPRASAMLTRRFAPYSLTVLKIPVTTTVHPNRKTALNRYSN